VVAAGGFSPPAEGNGNATATFETLPAFCRVEATLMPSSDSDIRVEVWLPVSDWNGKLQAVGNGGWQGSISYEALGRALSRRYAAASTDTGHQGGRASFAIGHPEKLTDFSYRAVHEMTVAAKAIVASHYGTAPRKSYWNGCSSGGRQGLKEAQQFPDDFDGIIAGAPANNWVRQKAANIAIQQVVHRDAASEIPATKYPLIHEAMLQACDRLDGVPDGVLENPLQCSFDPNVLVCQGADASSCLTPQQVATARALYAPVTNPRTGAEIFPGLPRGTELGWNTPAGPEPRPTQWDLWAYVVFQDPQWDYRTLDLDRDVALAEKMDAEVVRTAAVDPDLQPFFSRGGKLLMYHGWADPNIVATNSVNYYRSVVQSLGGVEHVDDSFRLFMVPGMGHCRGGKGTDTFDMVGALERWVELGEAPARIEASRVRDGVVDRTRPLCPYPKVAAYLGSGSPDQSANFECRPLAKNGER
jgi:feruloyl esterase